MNHSTQHPDEYAASPHRPTRPPPKTPRATAPPGPAMHWLMWLMCLPMVLLVGALIAHRSPSASAASFAAGCLLMMGLMMAG